ncbi:hypothetical protein [Halegenticoccus tardaugens]|uniref:hypothetical protein n=1 Tax=Halegenticoccus tardaugens TaxID=2071624 RepID=UPI00100BE1D5|nr:hypothetical protein [Halegenticoccus tardaugens]
MHGSALLALASPIQVSEIAGIPPGELFALLLAAGFAILVGRVLLSVASFVLGVAWRVVTVATVAAGVLFLVSTLVPGFP